MKLLVNIDTFMYSHAANNGIIDCKHSVPLPAIPMNAPLCPPPQSPKSPCVNVGR